MPRGELSRLAEVQRREELKKKVAGPPRPLFPKFRELILENACPAAAQKSGAVLEKESFGELERLVTQKLFDVARGVAGEGHAGARWLRLVARSARRNYKQTRATILEFMNTGVFSGSVEHCVPYLLLIESWDIDLETFGMEILLDGRIAPDRIKRFEFREREPEQPASWKLGSKSFCATKP